jgi:hypothetical protein
MSDKKKEVAAIAVVKTIIEHHEQKFATKDIRPPSSWATQGKQMIMADRSIMQHRRRPH